MAGSPKLTRSQYAFIQDSRVARLATVDSNGEAYLVPICYAYDGVRFVSPIDEKPKQHDRPLKRVRNIRETGRASLIIDHYDDGDWSQLAWLMVRGRAEIIRPDHDLHIASVQLLRIRYEQYQTMHLEDAEIIALTPERIVSWGLAEDPGDG